MRLTMITASMTLLLLLGACGSLSNKAPTTVDLTGVWRLNEALSDDPKDMMRAGPPGRGNQQGEGPQGDEQRGGGQRGRGNRRTGGDREGGGSGPFGGSSGGRGGAGGGQGRVGGSGDGMMAHLTAVELDIEQRSDTTRIEYDGKATTIYHWGSDKDRRYSSGWNNLGFVVKTGGDRGPSLERVFTVSADGNTLTVITRFDDQEMRQLYDLDEAETLKVYNR